MKSRIYLSGASQAPLRRLSGASQAPLRRLSGASQAPLRRLSGASQAPLRRLSGALLALALLSGPTRPARSQAAPNLALTATASASSVWENGTAFAANKANDGDPTTRWNAASGDQNGSWVELDWKAPVTFNKVAIDEDFNRVQAYELQVPDGKGGWNTIYNSAGTNINPTGSGTPTYLTTYSTPVTTTGLRMLIDMASTVPSLFEIRVYNVPLGTLAGTVTDSSSKPIQGVVVTAGGANATTDASGKYSLTVEAGTTNVTAGEVGVYRSHSALNVKVGANATVTQDFSLLTLPTNLAKTATADASTFYQSNATYDATKINDGDLTTRWNSDGGDIAGSWVSLKWPTAQTFNTITIHEALGRITDYSIQVYSDAKMDFVDMTPVLEKTLPASGSDRVLTTVLQSPVTTKGIKILINAASSLPSIWEVEVSNAPLGTISGTVEDIATGKPVPGATVTLSPGGDIATADAMGKFSAQIGPDEYLINAGAMGFFGGTQQVITVDSGKTTSLVLGVPAQGTNLALAGTASDSSDDGTNVATNVNDGDPMTFWESDPTMTTDQWIGVTFKQATTFNVVNLVGFIHTIQKSDIQYLDTDGKTWVDVPGTNINPETLAVQGKPALLIFDKPVTSTAVRYFVSYTNSMTSAPGLSELQVFNSPIGQSVGGGPLLGDINGDGKVDLKDATLSLQIAVGNLPNITDAQKAANDVNKDSKSDLKDTTLILEAAVGLIKLM